jgi:hypothetical protein
MKTFYGDILERISEPPSWWDTNGVPRYGAFDPRKTSVYAHEVALLKVCCQECRREFAVALFYDLDEPGRLLFEEIQRSSVHYGDPPRPLGEGKWGTDSDGTPMEGCCLSGPTMNSVPRQVLEYWHRGADTEYGWVRDPTYELSLKPDWWDEEE